MMLLTRREREALRESFRPKRIRIETGLRKLR
jgi:hypothetical protein